MVDLIGVMMSMEVIPVISIGILQQSLLISTNNICLLVDNIKDIMVTTISLTSLSFELYKFLCSLHLIIYVHVLILNIIIQGNKISQ